MGWGGSGWGGVGLCRVGWGGVGRCVVVCSGVQRCGVAWRGVACCAVVWCAQEWGGMWSGVVRFDYVSGKVKCGELSPSIPPDRQD